MRAGVEHGALWADMDTRLAVAVEHVQFPAPGFVRLRVVPLVPCPVPSLTRHAPSG
jgi:hypothetical protein